MNYHKTIKVIETLVMTPTLATPKGIQIVRKPLTDKSYELLQNDKSYRNTSNDNRDQVDDCNSTTQENKDNNQKIRNNCTWKHQLCKHRKTWEESVTVYNLKYQKKRV